MSILIPRYPLHISERIISLLEFEGNYTRGELEMWAELNSYPYLKRSIAKSRSIVIYIQYFLDDSPEITVKHYLKDETIELLSRTTDSFFLLVTRPLSMDQGPLMQVLDEISLGLALFVVDVFNYLGLLPREHDGYFDVLTPIEFIRLMKQAQYKPASMYVITQFPRQKYAMESLCCPPRLLPKVPFMAYVGLDGSDTGPVLRATYPLLSELGGFADDICVWGFTNPVCPGLRDFADNIYLKEGYLCKIENYWKRLLMVLMIKMSSKCAQKRIKGAWW